MTDLLLLFDSINHILTKICALLLLTLNPIVAVGLLFWSIYAIWQANRNLQRFYRWNSTQLASRRIMVMKRNQLICRSKYILMIIICVLELIISLFAGGASLIGLKYKNYPDSISNNPCRLEGLLMFESNSYIGRAVVSIVKCVTGIIFLAMNRQLVYYLIDVYNDREHETPHLRNSAILLVKCLLVIFLSIFLVTYILGLLLFLFFLLIEFIYLCIGCKKLYSLIKIRQRELANSDLAGKDMIRVQFHFSLFKWGLPFYITGMCSLVIAEIGFFFIEEFFQIIWKLPCSLRIAYGAKETIPFLDKYHYEGNIIFQIIQICIQLSEILNSILLYAPGCIAILALAVGFLYRGWQKKKFERKLNEHNEDLLQKLLDKNYKAYTNKHFYYFN